MSETPGSAPSGESGTKELTGWTKYDVEVLLPEAGDLKAEGCSDAEAREELLRRHEGPQWEEAVGLALKMVTEEQVREARKETMEDAIRYVTRMKANDFSDYLIERVGSSYGGPFAGFVKKAMGRVTKEQIEEWRQRRPKPKPPVMPEPADDAKLIEQLKRQPGYRSLTREEQELAERIVLMRWDEKNYVTIRVLCGGRWSLVDPGNLERFNRAWVVTNFVKAEMRAGKELPRPSSTPRKSKRKPSSHEIYWEAIYRDVGVMKLWMAEDKCAMCGKPTTGDWIQKGIDMSHGHSSDYCPVCGRRFERHEGGASVQYGFDLGWFMNDSQMYCAEHRPHVLDKRDISVEAQEAFLKEKAAEAERESQKAKEKRDQERREQLRRERGEERRDSEYYYERHYDEDEARERRLEDPDW